MKAGNGVRHPSLHTFAYLLGFGYLTCASSTMTGCLRARRAHDEEAKENGDR